MLTIYKVHLTLTRTITTLNIFVCISAGVEKLDDRHETLRPVAFGHSGPGKGLWPSVTYPHLVLAKAQIDVRRETDLVYGIGIR